MRPPSPPARVTTLLLASITAAAVPACGRPAASGRGAATSDSDGAALTASTDSGPATQSASPHATADAPIRAARDSSRGRAAAPSTADTAADVIRRYYRAIAERRYRVAYGLWGDQGRDSRQTFDEFAAGFAHTDRVRVDIGTPGRVEGAAGSWYVEIPVVVSAVTDSGERQQFRGSFTLRRAVVEGASEAERRWHIYSADLRAVG